ncbi:GNAT family N-acetyltransferase [Streptomyces azureus]|nr:GNAT family N-acetyltransferase [Streptomyces azureus]
MSSQREIILPPSIRLSGDGILLREWAESDLSALVEIYDDPEIDRWTPVPSPFDSRAAREYLTKAREGREEGRKKAQLAITTDGEQPRGEVLLFRSELDARDLSSRMASAADIGGRAWPHELSN